MPWKECHVLVRVNSHELALQVTIAASPVDLELCLVSWVHRPRALAATAKTDHPTGRDVGGFHLWSDMILTPSRQKRSPLQRRANRATEQSRTGISLTTELDGCGASSRPDAPDEQDRRKTDGQLTQRGREEDVHQGLLRGMLERVTVGDRVA